MVKNFGEVFRSAEHLLAGILRISEAKNVLRKWIKSNVPLSEENLTV